MDQPVLAPPWRISEWLNTTKALDLETQRGHVVVACAFQMLCPGCVSHDIPQLKAVHDLFAPLGAMVVSLHTVFEHHETMTTTALRAFIMSIESGVRSASTPQRWLARRFRRPWRHTGCRVRRRCS